MSLAAPHYYRCLQRVVTGIRKRCGTLTCYPHCHDVRNGSVKLKYALFTLVRRDTATSGEIQIEDVQNMSGLIIVDGTEEKHASVTRKRGRKRKPRSSWVLPAASLS